VRTSPEVSATAVLVLANSCGVTTAPARFTTARPRYTWQRVVSQVSPALLPAISASTQLRAATACALSASISQYDGLSCGTTPRRYCSSATWLRTSKSVLFSRTSWIVPRYQVPREELEPTTAPRLSLSELRAVTVSSGAVKAWTGP